VCGKGEGAVEPSCIAKQQCGKWKKKRTRASLASDDALKSGHTDMTGAERKVNVGKEKEIHMNRWSTVQRKGGRKKCWQVVITRLCVSQRT